MKIIHNTPEHFEVRTKKRFLFFPKTLYNLQRDKKITRWLEVAEWSQMYTSKLQVNGSGYTEEVYDWVDVSWIDL